MALSLEQDGQELVDDTDSAPSRGGGRFRVVVRVASIVSQRTKGVDSAGSDSGTRLTGGVGRSLAHL